MRLREKDVPLDPEVGRELEGLDRALAGEPVEPDLEELATLARDLRGERPEPEAEFAEELDSRAAERFPRELAGVWAGLARLGERLGSVPPRRLLATAGAAASVIVVAGVTVSQVGELGGGGGTPPGRSVQPAAAPEDAATAEEAQPSAPDGGDLGSAAGDVTTKRAVPLTDGRRLRFNRAAPGPSAAAPPVVPPGPGPIFPSERNRKVERAANLALSADPSQVDDVADEVVEVAERHRGIVLFSDVSSGEQRPRAAFELAIPASRLSAALDDLSDLAHVRSLNEGTRDITPEFVTVHDRLERLRDKRDRLLEDLEAATTPIEAESVRRQLRIVQRQIADLKTEVRGLERRVHFARVAVTIEAGDSDGEGWSLGDAVDDAGRVLEVTAGIILVSAAVLLPLALLALVAWLIGRSWISYRREQALD